MTLPADRQHVSPFIDDPLVYARATDAMERILEGASEISTKGYTYVILGEILKFVQTDPHTESEVPLFTAEILLYINKHFTEELPLSRLSAQFGYNPSYFSRAFTQSFGISYSQYLTMIRLRKAILLMQSGDRTVTECAFESGFGSARSFYRSFYERFGCSPKDYFKRNQSK